MIPLDLLTLAFWLVALHFIADFHLQTDFIVREKAPSGNAIWPWVMSAHAAMHGIMVALVLSPIYGVAEWVAHWLIDYAKSTGRLRSGAWDVHLDQALHLVVKGLWLALYAGFSS
ncbi:MAG: DUF3307 domain-containing protein [Pseudomonadota bacterium]